MHLTQLIARINTVTQRRLFKLQAICVVALLLSACGSTSQPPIVPESRPSTTNTQADVVYTPETPQELIYRAQTEWLDNRDISVRNATLINAADGFATQQIQSCEKALKVIEQIYSEINEASLKNHANLIIAECTPKDQIELSQRSQLVAIPSRSVALRDRQKRVQAQIFAEQQQWLAAAQSLAQISEIDAIDTQQIWSWVQAVDYKTQQTSINRYPNLRQWLALSAMLHEYGTTPTLLASNFAQFSADYPQHPLVVHTPNEFIDGIAASFSVPRQIGVVLPLSGRLAAQGNAIKQGILSAYFTAANTQNLDQTIRFYDSAMISVDDLAEQLTDVELVIGPLLKPTIEALTPKLSPSTVLVALNRIDNNDNNTLDADINQLESSDMPNGPLPQQRFYFALAPEDEAQQMAEHIYQQGYRSPILVHAQDAIGQRLAAAFLSQWRSLTAQQTNDGISIVSYTDNDGMREGILSSLDVAQSKNRITQLERLLVPELYNVPRNRRDVDAIVAFATPEQTELLNPIVESSLSPFNEKTVPVYVTSRSISMDVTKNQLRDLQNVYFIDLPWMMPNNSWRELTAEVETLYPNQRDSTKRLFALGFDAYSQLHNLPHLAAIPQLTAQALSGTLSVNQSQQVIRKLPMAVIDNEQVKVLVER